MYCVEANWLQFWKIVWYLIVLIPDLCTLTSFNNTYNWLNGMFGIVFIFLKMI